MARQVVSNLGLQPTIEVRRVTGDVKVEGWDKPDLEASGDDPRVDRDTDVIAISGVGDVEVCMPRTANLRISSLVGDLSLKDLAGNVEIAGLAGELSVTNVTGSLSMRGATISASAQRGWSAGESGNDSRRNLTDAQGIVGAVSRAAQRATEARRRAEEKINAADRKLQRVLGKRASIAGGFRGRRAVQGRDVIQTSEPATEEERLAILKMVQSKKITAVQADLLLAALEGQKAETTEAGPQGAEDGRR
jgi:SHOCT-like protein